MPRFSTNLVHAQVLTPYATSLGAVGAPVEALFEGCGIPVEAVRDPAALITMFQAYAFAEEGARHLEDPTLGAAVGRQVTFEDLGQLGTVILRSPSLFDASRHLKDAIEASEPGSQCWVEHHRERAWLCYRPLERFEHGGGQAELFDLQCLLAMIRRAAGAGWQPEGVLVSATTESTLSRVEEFAEARVERHASVTAIAFPPALFSRVLERPEGEGPLSETGTEGEGPGVLEAVRQLLETLAPHEPVPSLVTVADCFGISGRTLQRCLEAEGTTYRSVVEGWRFRQATRLLSQESIPLKAVAAELGYGSLNSFVRGFRQIAGVTPDVFRRQRQSD